MKKLYIPTSTLNFNNILSSESISPEAFYTRRGFGYNRWTNFPENNLGNVVLLYEKPFFFSRPKGDTEDHPMLIEIETDEEFPQTNVPDVFYSDHTIYFVRRYTHFFFMNEQEMQITISLSQSSSETKLVSLYERQMLTNKLPERQRSEEVLVNIKLNEDEIKKDVHINKMKGLLYGYYIGAYLSTPKPITESHQRLCELRNIFGAVNSSENKHPTQYQKKIIENILLEIKREELKPLLEICGSNDPETAVDMEYELIKKGWTPPRNYFEPKDIIQQLSSKGKIDKVAHWLEKQEEQLHIDEQKERKTLPVNLKEITVNNNSLTNISPKGLLSKEEQELIKEWVNDIFISRKYNNCISTFNSDLATEITLKAKEHFGETWEHRGIKVWLNNMRKYINKENDVEIAWSNPLIASITSVLTKGENHNELINFMRSKSISDYKIAFAFYGILHGYAYLTRDFTDYLYENKDQNYIGDVYKAIYEQIHGKSFPKPASTEPATPNISPTPSIDEKPTDETRWKETIRKIIQKNRGRKIYNASIGNIIDKSSNHIECIKELKKPLKGSKKLLEKLYKEFDSQENNPQKHECGQLDMNFSEQSTDHKLFYNDPKAWEHIRDFIPQNHQNKLKGDFDWFIKQMRKPKGKSAYYPNIDEQDNETVITKFCTLKQEMKTEYFNNDTREKVKQRLLEIYCNGSK